MASVPFDCDNVNTCSVDVHDNALSSGIDIGDDSERGECAGAQMSQAAPLAHPSKSEASMLLTSTVGPGMVAPYPDGVEEQLEISPRPRHEEVGLEVDSSGCLEIGLCQGSSMATTDDGLLHGEGGDTKVRLAVCDCRLCCGIHWGG